MYFFLPGDAHYIMEFNIRVRPGKVVFHPCMHPTASNFIIAVINHVHSYIDAKKVGYHFITQQMSLAPQKRW